MTYFLIILDNINASHFSITDREMDEGEIVTENFISSKDRPVSRNLKFEANLTSAHKESLITAFLVVDYRVIFLSSSLNS